MIEHVETEPKLQATRCAICGTQGNATEMYASTLTSHAFDARTFSARRQPDRVHYRMVRCNTCGLVRSDPAADPASVAGLYASSSFDYASEVANLKRTYGRYLARLDRHGAGRDGLLEVGCGNGFFLEEAVRQGYKNVRGIEPSHHAIQAAPESVRALISEDVLRPGTLASDWFDVVCLFQVFDHLPDPGEALDELHRGLRTGGLALFLNHDEGAASAKVLGERSPIVDVEHYYLYSQETLGKLVARHGFTVVESGSVWNQYRLTYFARLVPAPGGAKDAAARFLDWSRLGRLEPSLPLGNQYLVARKK